MKSILLVTHFNYSDAGPIHGPTHTIIDFLKNKKIPYKLIAHPLYSGRLSFIETFDGKKEKIDEFGTKINLNLLLKSVVEFWQTVRLSYGENYSMIIAIDPLNVMPCLLLKVLGLSDKLIFYTVDYAKKRFPNIFLNVVYHLLDLIAIRFSDKVWNVSTRIVEVRKSQGIEREKNIYVPNAPDFSGFRKHLLARKNRYRIFMVVGKTHTPILETVVKSFKKVSKKYPKAKLVLAGPLEKKVSSNKNIIFLGPLPHKKLMKEMSKSGIGLAIYTKDFEWTHFGDSMKAREYLASGLPVIISDVVSTSEDIKKYNAGIVVKSNMKAIAQAIDQMLGSKNEWRAKRLNAVKLAKDSDINLILSKNISI